ncbi:hypothetical protein IIC44_00540 [Patescibacteria group bacterium]|nr:hypothetical protein [Patescibacteria group bacterium]
MIKTIIFDWGGTLAPSDNKIAAVRLKKNFTFDNIKFKNYFMEHEDDTCDSNNYKKILRDPLRHEWISLLLFLAFVNEETDDQTVSEIRGDPGPLRTGRKLAWLLN